MIKIKQQYILRTASLDSKKIVKRTIILYVYECVVYLGEISDFGDKKDK